VIQRPQPEVVTDTAAGADKEDGEPPAGGETGPRVEETFRSGKQRQESDRRQHGQRAGTGVLSKVRSVEDATDGAAERARQDGKFSDPLVGCATWFHHLLAQRERHSHDRDKHAQRLRNRESLLSEERCKQHRQ
jgi:hypothetical protein